MECLKCKKSIPEDALFCPYCGKKQTVAQPRKRKKRANGMGTICKKSGNRAKPWEAQKNGVYIGLFATRFEAEKALESVRELRTDEMLNMTFSDVYAKWLPEHSREISGKGVEGYHRRGLYASRRRRGCQRSAKGHGYRQITDM